MKQVRFVIVGPPMGKGRPRFNTKTGHAITPDKTANYETLVKWEYQRQCEGFRFDDDAMLDMRIIAYYPIPKSGTKTVLEQKRRNRLRPTKKPDCDNVVKIIADSLNLLAYHDDAQIVDCQVRKFFSEEPRVEVIIRQIGGDG